MTGERGLLYAVLEMAVRDNAARWFRDPGGDDRPFSFHWVCASLGLDAPRIAADLPGIAERLRKARRYVRKNRGGI